MTSAKNKIRFADLTNGHGHAMNNAVASFASGSLAESSRSQGVHPRRLASAPIAPVKDKGSCGTTTTPCLGRGFLIFGICRTCGGNLIEQYDDTKCLQCGRPTVPARHADLEEDPNRRLLPPWDR